jgi:hypothetical protein
MPAIVHFSPNSDGRVSCGYQPPNGWAADTGANAWSGDKSQISCGACAAAMKANAPPADTAKSAPK